MLEYLESLTDILHLKGYFSFRETSCSYVDELVGDILTRLPLRPHKPAPKYFDKYGKGLRYAAFPKNKQTTWYVFFRIYRQSNETIYQVRYITNSHVAAQHL